MNYADSYSGKMVVVLSTVFLAIAAGLLIYFIEPRQSFSKVVIIVGGVVAFCIGSVYIFRVSQDPFQSLPFILSTLWIVVSEPAICDILALIALILLIINGMAGKLALRRISFVDALLIMYLVLNVNNLFSTDDVIYSVRHFLISLYLLGFYFLISVLADSNNKIHHILRLYRIPVVFTCITMLLGFLVSQYFPEKFPTLRDLILLGNRPKGFFKDPNVAGPFLIPATVYSLLIILTTRGKTSALLGFFCIMTIIGVFLSFSRGAIIALLISIILTIVFSLNRRNIIRIVGLVTLCSSCLLVLLYFSPYGSQANRIYNREYGIKERIARLEKGVQYFKESPIVGVGMTGIGRDDEPHDTYLLILKRTGIVGTLCFWLSLFYFLVRLIMNYRLSDDKSYKIICLTLAISLLSLMVSGVAVSFLHWRHFWLVAGLASAAVQASVNQKRLRVMPYS